MAKGEPASSGFLSKVAKFVRHPTVDWSELEARTQGVDEEREALKAAIQRKKRNDRVRHRELNELRELMRQRPQAAGDDAAPVSEPRTSQPPAGGAADKSRTIEQIARIEEQMSEHWLHRRGTDEGSGERIGSGTTIPARLEGGVTVPAHLQARSAEPEFSISIDVVTEDPNAGAGELGTALAHPLITEAAVRFANGQFDEAEKALRALMVQEALSPTARAAAAVLLDVLYARGDLEGFEEFAAEYSERFALPVPRWPGPAAPTPARPDPDGAPATGELPAQAASAWTTWTCPLLLEAAVVADLQALVARGGGHAWLDWTDLLSADLPAAQALLTLVDAWLTQPIEFHFRGAAVLRRRLKASTPSGRRENDPVWWLLRLALLRLMQRKDEFELAALDYCVTYGVLPPEWQATVCRFQVAEAMPAEAAAAPEPALLPERVAEPIHPLDTQLAGLDVLEWPAMVTTMVSGETQFPSIATTQSLDWPSTQPMPHGVSAALTGVLHGDVLQTLAQLDSALDRHPIDQPFRIDCHPLQRVDFAAAGSLLQWFMGATSRGLKVELVDVSRLVAVFFHVVGIDEAVTVRLRQY